MDFISRGRPARSLLLAGAASLAFVSTASAGVMTTARTYSMEASTGVTAFTVPAFNLIGQVLTGVTVALSGNLSASAVASNISPDHQIFVTANYTSGYQLTGPDGVVVTNAPMTLSASGAVERARDGTPGTLFIASAGSAAEMVFLTATGLASFQGPTDLTFNLASTSLSATTTCNVVVPGPRPDCGLPGNGFGPVSGTNTVTAKISYLYSADPNYAPPSPPASPPPAASPPLFDPSPQAVPEPGTAALLSMGVFGLGLLRRGRVSEPCAQEPGVSAPARG